MLLQSGIKKINFVGISPNSPYAANKAKYRK